MNDNRSHVGTNLSSNTTITCSLCKVVDVMANSNILANGSSESVHLWAHLYFSRNTQQQEAFKVIASQFVLSICDEIEQDKTSQNSLPYSLSYTYICNKRKLRNNVFDQQDTTQLLLLLLGPCGSQIYAVITQVVTYCRCFCWNIF